MPIWPWSRIRALEQENLNLRADVIANIANLHLRDREIANLHDQITYLTRTIREMDTLIFSMGQCTEWSRMRPYFQRLHDEMTARRVEESNRINTIVTDELSKPYIPPMTHIEDLSND